MSLQRLIKVYFILKLDFKSPCKHASSTEIQVLKVEVADPDKVTESRSTPACIQTSQTGMGRGILLIR